MINKTPKILFALLFSLYAFYCLACFFLVPVLVKPLVLEQTNKLLRGEFQLESLSFNPFTNSLTFSNIQLEDAAGNNLLALDNLYINIDLWPLITQNLHIKIIKANNLKLNNTLITNTETSETRSQQWLLLPELLIDNLSIGLSNHSVTIETISLQSLRTALRVDHQGGNNIQPYIEQLTQLFVSENTPEESMPTSERSWRVILENLSLLDASIEVTDTTLQPEITNVFNPISLRVKNIHSDLSEAVLINIEINAFEGLIKLEGKAHPQTRESAFTYTLEKIQLKNLNHYVNYFTYLQIESGELNSSGIINTLQINASEILIDENTKSEVSKTKKEILNVSITNNNSITQLLLSREDEENPFLQCELISHQDLQFFLAESTLSLSDFMIDQCVIYALINKDGSTNFDIVKKHDTITQGSEKNPGMKEEPTKSNKTSSPLNITINGIYLKDSLLSLRDLSQGEPAHITIKNIEGSLTNIKQGDKYLSPLLLTAMVNEHAPLEIKGQGNFANPDLSLKTNLSLKTLGLKGFSAYTQNLSKRPVEKGALSLNLSYQLENNMIDGKNILLIENLNLGSKQNIESAHNLPLGLAVSVLKDSKGNINIDIPVKGNLNDPTFSVNKQILRTLAGLITKAATSPLTALGGLGAMVTQQETPSEFVFEAGSALLSDAYDKKITALAQTLKAHPELALKIIAHASEQDLLALQTELAVPTTQTETQPATQTQTSPVEFNHELQMTTLKQQRAIHLRTKLMALGILPEQLLLVEGPTQSEQTGPTENTEPQNSLIKSSVNVELFAR